MRIIAPPIEQNYTPPRCSSIFEAINPSSAEGKDIILRVTDRRDLVVLLLAFPELKAAFSPVADCLHKAQASTEVLTLWQELVDQELLPETDEDDF